jgi:hypothetical protein
MRDIRHKPEPAQEGARVYARRRKFWKSGVLRVASEEAVDDAKVNFVRPYNYFVDIDRFFPKDFFYCNGYKSSQIKHDIGVQNAIGIWETEEPY